MGSTRVETGEWAQSDAPQLDYEALLTAHGIGKLISKYQGRAVAQWK